MRIDRSPWGECRGIAAEKPRPLPRILMTLGDPAGIGSELVAKLLARPTEMRDARIVILADKAELENGLIVCLLPISRGEPCLCSTVPRCTR